MIYTITLNPSVDYFIGVAKELMDTEVNRADYERLKAGGKGLNVAMVLHELHIPSTAIAALGGFSGAYIRDYLKEKNYITLKEIPMNGANRINVKIMNHDQIICINGSGPAHEEKTISMLKAFLHQTNETDWVMINGSYAHQLTQDELLELSAYISERGAKLIMDVEGLDAKQLRQMKPYLIKPNRYEFSLLLKEEISGERIIDQAKAVLDQGAASILLSLGKEGAFYISPTACYRLTHDALNTVNPSGSGDAMLAAFIGRLSLGDSIEEALRWGGACGMAAASTLADIDRERIECFLDRCHVESCKCFL